MFHVEDMYSYDLCLGLYNIRMFISNFHFKWRSLFESLFFSLHYDINSSIFQWKSVKTLGTPCFFNLEVLALLLPNCTISTSESSLTVFCYLPFLFLKLWLDLSEKIKIKCIVGQWRPELVCISNENHTCSHFYGHVFLIIFQLGLIKKVCTSFNL